MNPSTLVYVIVVALVIGAFAGGYLFAQHQAYEAITPDKLNAIEKRRPAFEAWEREAPGQHC